MFIAKSFSYSPFLSQNFNTNSNSYVGPSSYETSFSRLPYGSDYPGYGNFGSMMNMKNPSFSSSYTSFGPSTTNSFGSTSYINYPETVVKENSYYQGNSYSSEQWPAKQNPSVPGLINIAQNLNPAGQDSSGKTLSQHIEVTKPIAVPVYKRFPYAVPKNFPVVIPHPVLGNIFLIL
jgi:hypothetical protein